MRPVTTEEKSVFDQEVALATRHRLEQAATHKRDVDSKKATAGEKLLVCILMPIACLTAIVATPVLLGGIAVSEKAEEWAPLRTGEKVIRESSLETLLIRATRSLQDESLPPSTDQVMEYRLVHANIGPWKTEEIFSGYCLSVAVELAFLEGGRTTWREPYVVGGGDRSRDASEASCWNFASSLPRTEAAWQSVLEIVANDIAQALRRRTPGAGWMRLTESTSDLPSSPAP